jgi:hypothetical protein
MAEIRERLVDRLFDLLKLRYDLLEANKNIDVGSLDILISKAKGPMDKEDVLWAENEVASYYKK